MSTHGFATLPWDHAMFPESFWQSIARTSTFNEHGKIANDCWFWSRGRVGSRQANPQEYVITRMLDIDWSEVLSWSPTCANLDCVNPAHLCVVLRDKGVASWSTP